MNWRSAKFIGEDDYGKPILLRVMDDGHEEPRYISCFITKHKTIGIVGMVGGERITFVNDEFIPDNAYYIRIDEIKF